MMITLITSCLAVFWAWETLVSFSPVNISAWLQPVLVAGFAFCLPHLPASWVMAAAVAGGVAVLHRLVAVRETRPILVRRGRGGVPRV